VFTAWLRPVAHSVHWRRLLGVADRFSRVRSIDSDRLGPAETVGPQGCNPPDTRRIPFGRPACTAGPPSLITRALAAPMIAGRVGLTSIRPRAVQRPPYAASALMRDAAGRTSAVGAESGAPASGLEPEIEGPKPSVMPISPRRIAGGHHRRSGSPNDSGCPAPGGRRSIAADSSAAAVEASPSPRPVRRTHRPARSLDAPEPPSGPATSGVTSLEGQSCGAVTLV
jgi:hypothetical protein